MPWGAEARVRKGRRSPARRRRHFEFLASQNQSSPSSRSNAALGVASDTCPVSRSSGTVVGALRRPFLRAERFRTRSTFRHDVARARRGGIVARRNSVSAGASSHLAVSAPRSRWRRDDLRSHQALRPAPRELRHVRTVRHASGVRRAQLLVVPLAQARLRGVHVAALAAGMRAARGGREGGGARGRQGAAVRAVRRPLVGTGFCKNK